jgi:hypothetical protein
MERSLHESSRLGRVDAGCALHACWAFLCWHMGGSVGIPYYGQHESPLHHDGLPLKPSSPLMIKQKNIQKKLSLRLYETRREKSSAEAGMLAARLEVRGAKMLCFTAQHFFPSRACLGRNQPMTPSMCLPHPWGSAGT